MAFTFTTPGMALGAIAPKPTSVTPAASTTLPRPRFPFGFIRPVTTTVPPVQNTPGTRLGSAPAPLGSPTLGGVVSPAVALAAAVAGARAAIAAGNKG